MPKGIYNHKNYPNIGFQKGHPSYLTEESKKKIKETCKKNGIGKWSKGKPMTIIGDGKQTRSFTYVDDVVKANILTMKSKKIGRGEIINIATGPRSKCNINQLAEIIGKDNIVNLIKNKKVVYVPPRPVEVRHSSADISKAKKLLGWEPKISLKEGIKRMKNNSAII